MLSLFWEFWLSSDCDIYSIYVILLAKNKSDQCGQFIFLFPNSLNTYYMSVQRALTISMVNIDNVRMKKNANLNYYLQGDDKYVIMQLFPV